MSKFYSISTTLPSALLLTLIAMHSLARPRSSHYFFRCPSNVHVAVPPDIEGMLLSQPHQKLSLNKITPSHRIRPLYSEPFGLDSLALCQQVPNFRWQDQGTSIIASVEINDHHGRVFGHILVDKMASLWEDMQSILACSTVSFRVNYTPE